MARFRHSFCSPFSSEIEELGDIEENELIDKFNKIPWDGIIQKMSTMSESEIHYSPSIEFEDKSTKHGLTMSGVGDKNLEEFYVFYKRPKRVKRFFGLFEHDNPNYLTDVLGQTRQNVVELINALIEKNYQLLDQKIKR